MDFLLFLLVYAGPFILAGLLLLLWAWTAYKLRFKFPRYYDFCCKLYDKLPKIGAIVVIVIFLYFYLTKTSVYDGN